MHANERLASSQKIFERDQVPCDNLKDQKIDVKELIAERDELLAQVAEYKQQATRNKEITDLVAERDMLKAKVDEYKEVVNRKYVMTEEERKNLRSQTQTNNQRPLKIMQQHFSRRVNVRTLKLKKMPVAIPTLPKGIDAQSFHQAPVDEKVKMIPTDFINEIKLEQKVKIFSNKDELEKLKSVILDGSA